MLCCCVHVENFPLGHLTRSRPPNRKFHHSPGADARLRLAREGLRGRHAGVHAAQHQDDGRLPPRVPDDVRPGQYLLHRERGPDGGQHQCTYVCMGVTGVSLVVGRLGWSSGFVL